MSGLELHWSVKDSLIAYISRLEDGVVEALEPATRTESGFTFVLNEVASDFNPETHTGVLQFQGTAHFTGHWGMMNITIKDPRIEMTLGQGLLSIAQGGILSPEVHVPFAQVNVVPGSQPLKFTASLTAEGRGVLGEQYTVGQELSPLTLN
ncbi:HtaA domain-containing protein [Aurantimicrobium minutum]|uniref:HtaA domain-containing protein n=1 Tax=Aurantimicrobium minutum TaxID=708131 RepID=UPI002474D197|nr:HtaA domain-containing protein [Aurantimicrobium minutum]MDH6535865.1 hypothetical protein [Aurantimicrobium minutum]